MDSSSISPVSVVAPAALNSCDISYEMSHAPACLQVTRLKRAATNGDLQTVISTLAGIPADEVGQLDKACIVREVAQVRTTDNGLDGRLQHVLNVLAEAGWRMDGQDPPHQDNALHILARQGEGQATGRRIKFFVTWSMRQRPQRGHMLTARNAEQMTPDQWAASAEMFELADTFRRMRKKVEREIQQREAQQRETQQAGKARMAGDAGGRQKGPAVSTDTVQHGIEDGSADALATGAAFVGVAAFGLLGMAIQWLTSDRVKATQDADAEADHACGDTARCPPAKACPKQTVQAPTAVQRANSDHGHGRVTIEDVE